MSKYPISLNYFAKYMTLGNLSVGRVTILFKVWQDLAIQGSLYKEAALKEDWKEVNKRARKLNLYLSWLKEALKGGGAKGAKFVAPMEGVVNSTTSKYNLLVEKLGDKGDFLGKGTNIRLRRMSDEIAADAVKAAMKMDISIKNFNVVNDHVMEVLGNILAFCRVMNDAARNCQEKTIDATKKFIEVVIPLKSPLLLLAYYSRKDVGDEVGASLDFQNGATSISVNPAKGRKWEDRNGVSHYSMADYDDELRSVALKEATCMDEELYSIQQNIPEVIRRSAEMLMARHPDITSFVRLMAKFHITISNIDNVTLADMEKRQVTEEALEAFKKLKEQSRRNLVAGLANQIRWFAASHPAKDKSGNLQYAKGYKLALIALGVVLERAAKKEEEVGEPGQLSNFAFTVLKEEFILMVIHAVKNHQGIFSEGTPGENFEEAVEKLDVCDLEDGTTVEFVGGSAVEGNAFCANAKEIPDGVYTIRDLEGKMFACKNIEEVMEEAIPQKISGKFCFMTAEQVVGMPGDAEIFGEDLKAIVDNTKEVILSADVDGYKCAVVADETIVGAAALPTLVLGNKAANSAAEFFKNKKGVVGYSRALVYRTKSGKWAVRLFIVLEGVKPAVAADHKAAKLAKPMKPIILAPKAALKVSPSVAAALANLQ